MNMTENITLASPVGPRVYIVRHKDTADFRHFLRRMDKIMQDLAETAKTTTSSQMVVTEEISSQPLYDTLPETMDYQQERICCTILFALIILVVILVKIFRHFALHHINQQSPQQHQPDQQMQQPFYDKVTEDMELGIKVASASLLKANDVGDAGNLKKGLIVAAAGLKKK
jgi:hypothetical protein